MLKSQAISMHAKNNWEKFAVFVWDEDGDLVTQVDGKKYCARNVFELENSLDKGGCPSPRSLYFVDSPDYESEGE